MLPPLDDAHRDLREEQTPAFPDLRPPERHSGRLHSTTEVERELCQDFKIFLSLRAAKFPWVFLPSTLLFFPHKALPCRFIYSVFKFQGKCTRHSLVKKKS